MNDESARMHFAMDGKVAAADAKLLAKSEGALPSQTKPNIEPTISLQAGSAPNIA
jgi:hypothetical protein